MQTYIFATDDGIDLSDAANFLGVLSESVRERIIQIGPTQVVMSFPSTNGRSFSNNYYIKKLSNGEKVKREWIIYSKKLDAAFCFCCLLFDKQSDRCSVWSKNGFNTWKHIANSAKIHEYSSSHLDNYTRWKEHVASISTESSINLCLEKQLLDEKKRLKLVFQRLVSITSYLRRQNMAFAGANSTSGNFYELAQTFAEFDLVMKTHLENHSRNKYLTPETQNELIAIIGRKIAV